MIKKYIFILCLYILFSNLSYASWFDGKIEMRVCNNGNSVDALSCNNKCEKASIELEFQVNVASNVVLKKLFSKGKLFETTALDNCKVISKKNWLCETDVVSSWDSKRYITKHLMNDGVYAYINSINNVDSNFPICAK
jgi:hypothetical protein